MDIQWCVMRKYKIPHRENAKTGNFETLIYGPFKTSDDAVAWARHIKGYAHPMCIPTYDNDE